MSADRIFLVVLGGLFVATGLAYLFSPEGMAAYAEIRANVPPARTDVRATYGGIQIGFGIYMIWAAMAPARILGAIVATTLMIGGIGLARAFGLLTDGGANSWNLLALAFEVALTSAGVWLWSRTDTTPVPV